MFTSFSEIENTPASSSSLAADLFGNEHTDGRGKSSIDGQNQDEEIRGASASERRETGERYGTIEMQSRESRTQSYPKPTDEQDRKARKQHRMKPLDEQYRVFKSLEDPQKVRKKGEHTEAEDEMKESEEESEGVEDEDEDISGSEHKSAISQTFDVEQ
ncbi:unnamed protein product [Protopolystoma xenopodis]|uniref:Uncharacterized protein n=1 Tax=Protopolystoma xenopodis TaxID=117903 RepID=A0A448WU52_9PLAT|nr:unnamed protein product [Protopolystoma xenopodis]